MTPNHPKAPASSDHRPWLVMLSGSPWAAAAHRQQALAGELAGARRVLFVDPPTGRARFDVRQITDSLWQAGFPATVPLGGQLPPVNLAGRRLAARRLRQWLDARPGERVLWIDDDLAFPMIGHLAESAVVYDATDLAWTFTRRWNRRNRRRSLRRSVAGADLVLTSSSALPSRLPASRRPAVVLPNACDSELFSPAGPSTGWLDALPRPLLGYLGSIDTRALDGDLVAQVATRHPEWTFALIGPSTPAGRRPLTGLPNVHLFSPIPYAQAPAAVRSFDVGVIPYRVGGLIDYVHPKKCFEFLAAGKPVVATPLPALITLDATPIRLASGPDAFSAAITAALLAANSPGEIDERLAMGAANTWRDRGDRVDLLLTDLVAS